MNSLDQTGFEPDGTSSTSIQAQWLKTQLGASTSTWNVVVVHNPPFSSGTRHGSRERIQWPFAQWRADVVFSGDEHNYERILRDGIVYFVNGLGGAWIYPFGTPIEGSAVRYNDSHGAQRVTVTNSAMTFEFYSIENGGTLRDTYTITIPHNTATPTLPLISNGWQSPADQAAVKSNAGDNNGYEVNPIYAFANDSLPAMDIDSGISATSTCGDSVADKHKFTNYNLSIPSGATIEGIQVQLDANADSAVGNPKICVALSWNAGSTWTAWKSSPTLTTAEASYFLGAPYDAWEHTWLPEELSNTSFQVRVTNITSDNNADFSLDWIAVHVVYSIHPTSTSTATGSPTPTIAPSQTYTPTLTPSPTVEESQTNTPSPTIPAAPTDTPTATASSTVPALPTDTPVDTPSSTSTALLMDAGTPTPSSTPTDIPDETATAAPTETYTSTATQTPTLTSTPTSRPVSTWTATKTPTAPATLPNLRVRMGSTFSQSHSVPKGHGLRTSYPSVNQGPVKLASLNGFPMLGSERVIYKVNGVNTSFSEMMSLPYSMLDFTHWLPWYNNLDLNTELRLSVP